MVAGVGVVPTRVLLVCVLAYSELSYKVVKRSAVNSLTMLNQVFRSELNTRSIRFHTSRGLRSGGFAVGCFSHSSCGEALLCEPSSYGMYQSKFLNCLTHDTGCEQNEVGKLSPAQR